MSRDELKKFVRMIFASFNQQLFSADEAATFEAWWLQLSDCHYDGCVDQLRQIGLTEKYMPTPGAFKKAYLLTRTENPPPTPQQFWVYLQSIQKTANNGTVQNMGHQNPPHPIITATMKELGATAYTLTTNQDREQAYAVFNQHLTRWLLQATVVESK